MSRDSSTENWVNIVKVTAYHMNQYCLIVNQEKRCNNNDIALLSRIWKISTSIEKARFIITYLLPVPLCYIFWKSYTPVVVYCL